MEAILHKALRFLSKSDGEIVRLIATAMGLGEFFPEKSDMEWMQVLMGLPLFTQLGMTFDRLMNEKIIRSVWNGDPFVRGESAAFPTPQGRVRIYCEDPQPRTNWGQDLTGLAKKERLPYFKAPNEAWSENPLFEKYTLVYIQDHSRFRSHSQWFNVPTLRELDPEPYIRMNPDDAAARGLVEGDIAEMYNDRGHAVAKLRIDPAVKPGVATMPKGGVPYCVEACPARCRVFGDLDDPQSEISILLRERKYTRLAEDKGTGPNIFYLI